MKNELVVLEKLEVVPFFTKGDSVDEILAKIDAEARAHVPDLSTAKTRSEITKNINEIVTKSKTYLEESGKNLSVEYKAMPKVIDANRKKVKDFLTNLQAELRKPLTDWDDEQKRIKEEKAAKEEADRIAIEIETAHELAFFMDEKFNVELEVKLKAEDEAEKQRIADEAAAQAARDEEIRKQAAEEARKQAELEKAQLIIDNRHGDALLINRDIDDNIAEAKRIADKIEVDRLAQEQYEAAEIKRLADVAQAKIDAENEAEEKRLAEEKSNKDKLDAIEADRVKREDNQAHASMIMKQTKESLIALGLSEEHARSVTLALKNGKIANVGKINF